MKFSYPKKKKSFNLIATSDIAFLLLIFLVVTSSIEYSQEIAPPNSDYVEEIANEVESVTIEVNNEGKYSLLNYTFEISELATMLAGISRNAVIKIFADKEVDFSSITRLLDALQIDNRNDVFLMMEKTEE